ncbi:hypothetical protein [Deinococcus humi]|uniref:Integral membrane sensor domain MASE1 n=1 Tax=Deinococcus humi TaxID=662880 RepID=A0A7W8JS02_9DEIO|nr:hypothetical protein [Deinococcus humi]MBB5362106.1 integral membrane sensor domain MASE1 [Deinococcus humi]GGO22048.1 hypothetical protein GCM10008949_08910 [Deinococcus humi]
MTRTDALLILAIVVLALAGVADSPVWSPTLIVLGVGTAAWGWKRADVDDLLRLFA